MDKVTEGTHISFTGRMIACDRVRKWAEFNLSTDPESQEAVELKKQPS